MFFSLIEKIFHLVLTKKKFSSKIIKKGFDMGKFRDTINKFQTKKEQVISEIKENLFKDDNLNFIQPTMKVDMDFLSQLQDKILK